MPFPKGEARIGAKAKNPMPGVKCPSELILEALQKSRGNISRAADRLKMTRSHLHERIRKEPELKQCVDDFRQRFVDDCEDVAQSKALAGDTGMVTFMLKNLARDRGYDFERNVQVEATTRGVLEFIQNRSKNPAES